MDAAIRLGVLGCADVAGRKVLPALASVSEVRLVATASRTTAKAEAFAAKFGCEPVTGYQELLDRSDVDAVYLPLPSGLHAEWIEKALLAGKHVLAEKPLTTSHAETVRLTRLADSAGLALLENYMFPQHRQHDRVKQLVSDGAIGDVRALSASFTIPARAPGDIRWRPELGGGALLDTGGYPIRAAQLLLGADLAVLGASLAQDRPTGVDLDGSALLRHGNGATAQLTFGIAHGYTCAYALLGSTGRITVDRAFTPPAGFPPKVVLERRSGVEQVELPAEDQCAKTIRMFAAAVRNGRGTPAATKAMVRQAYLVDEIRRTAV
ncbi:Gfo/Idh/MocA family protein [Amycolatopsis sp. NPDC059090]|uniref:Gfo/Idh/MocA family protein n=1 Tax=unclassified Amycolatopsis TaxID=2618356 RepID=UPI00366D0F95